MKDKIYCGPASAAKNLLKGRVVYTTIENEKEVHVQGCPSCKEERRGNYCYECGDRVRNILIWVPDIYIEYKLKRYSSGDLGIYSRMDEKEDFIPVPEEEFTLEDFLKEEAFYWYDD